MFSQALHFHPCTVTFTVHLAANSIEQWVPKILLFSQSS